MRSPTRILPIVTVATIALGVAGCGTPPELNPPGSTVPSPSATASAPPSTLPPQPPPPPPPSPTATGFSESYAVACGGRPSGAQIITLLKRRGLLPSSYRSQPTTGPMCSGDWQWTVLDTSNGPIQAVSELSGNTLRLITAGTDVCTVEVRAGAPAGIRTAIGCV
ncbi:hypothetical protein [Asanoa siamensis]|uniref:Uncharacterized protein n=1 Tax=Asanoa siamensis TaxID=926357 RepID=A0ABQ4CIF2_9ACTN|nr:hypothetical protein [Asanoa siamensis]GIF71086.1 hypothetical protein Asi02nite_06040 [Asanoa siamensis]